jgi:hypothetical protein
LVFVDEASCFAFVDDAARFVYEAEKRSERYVYEGLEIEVLR